MRVALVGAGQIARQHLACLRTLGGVEVAAVCDRSPAVAESMAERFGVARWYADFREMLAEVHPDVVHVTTPAPSHFLLARDALDAGAHVVVEKPATETLEEVEDLLRRASERRRALVESHNYVFNKAPRDISRLIASGEFGAVRHVEVLVCLDILGPDSAFSDPNAPHPSLSMAGGAIADFLTHLASLAYVFVGPHRRAHHVWTRRRSSPLPYDEFRGLVEAERGTAVVGFSASAQPDAFWLRVYGDRMQASANLFETRLTVSRVRGGPRPLRPLWNGLDEARATRRGALGTLWRKLAGGPGAYEGLWHMLGRTYRALATGEELPVTATQVLEVNRLVAALKPSRTSS